jgi:non-ribosomal peptide synthase protein (TIGR01720 family)
MVKEQLRQVPNRGVGYGLLRYLNPDYEIAGALRGTPQAEIIFNYLGQVDNEVDDASPLVPAPESPGPVHSLHQNRRYLLEIIASITQSRLELTWKYSREIYRPATIERLAHAFVDALRSLIAHSEMIASRDYATPDFPEIELSQDIIEKALAEIDLG